MPAVPRPIYIEQGATFSLGFVYYEPLVDTDGNLVLDPDGNPQAGDPVPLTGCVARMQIRPKVGSDEIWVTATSADFALVDGVDNGGGRIFLERGGVTGRVDIVLTDTDTMNVTGKTGVYDVEIVFPLQPGELRPRVERVLEGKVTNDLNVTR